MPKTDWLRSNWLFLVFIALGLVLRLVWVNDMEWKSDEQWMYYKSVEAAKTGHWLGIGMESSGGVVNPGLSVAIFTAMAYFVNTPIGMAELVQWANVITILCFFVFILFKIEEEQRNVWLWGLAIASVSPLAVLFSRKIWEQDMLPVFCFLVIWSNACRKKGWGAFLWGFFGALIGQVHMSGFFYAFGLAVFTVVHDYRNKIPFKWGYWLSGSIIGSLGLIPWISYILNHPSPTSIAIAHIFTFNFYLDWFLDSHGLNTMYSLHQDFWSFIKGPTIEGHSTYLVGLLNIILACCGFYTIIRIWGYLKGLFAYITNKQLFNKLTTNICSTNFYLYSILLGLGIMMTFSGLWVYQHYLIVAFPFTYIFLAKIFQDRKKLLIGIIFAQFLVTVNFLVYIHTHAGAKGGDYGVSYRAQVKTP